MIDLVLNGAVVIAAVIVVLITARLALTPRLAISDFEGQTAELQKGLPRIIHSELEILRAEGGGTGLRFMTGPDKPIAVPEPVPTLPGFASVVQLVSLIPRRIHTVDAYMHAETPRGPALSVRLSRSELADAAATLHAGDFVEPVDADSPAAPASDEPSAEAAPAEPPAAKDKAAKGGSTGNDDAAESTPKPTGGPAKPAGAASGSHAYHRLAIAAAAWLAFRLPTRGTPGGPPAMLTTSWESYAHFRIGVEFFQAGDMASSRRSFARSLLHDPLNRGSLLNLAGLDVNTNCNGPAIDRLRLLCELLPDTDFPLDRLWYRARFNLAVACLNNEDSVPERLECRTDYSPAARRDIASAAIQEVIKRSRQVLRYYDRAGGRAVRRTASPEFIAFLRTVLGMAVVVRADIRSRA